MPELPQPCPQPGHITIHRWADELERTLRRCKGCGEWALADLCDWCADMLETVSYQIAWANPGWTVSHDGRVVHETGSLLEAENWVTRGGADTYELSNGCSTMGGQRPAKNGGAGGELELPPAGRSSTQEVRHNG